MVRTVHPGLYRLFYQNGGSSVTWPTNTPNGWKTLTLPSGAGTAGFDTTGGNNSFSMPMKGYSISVGLHLSLIACNSAVITKKRGGYTLHCFNGEVVQHPNLRSAVPIRTTRQVPIFRLPRAVSEKVIPFYFYPCNPWLKNPIKDISFSSKSHLYNNCVVPRAACAWFLHIYSHPGEQTRSETPPV